MTVKLYHIKLDFEAKDFALTEEVYAQGWRPMGFLSVAVPEAYGGMGMGFVSTVLNL